jgi:3-hydroxyisobutyrate dehydrogenase
MTNVAFLGTGMLGSGMVEGMLRRGDSVTVWNRTDSKARALEALGARVAPTPADAVANADHIHMTLPDDDIVERIVDSFRPRIQPDAVILDHSTTSPRRTKVRLEHMRQEGVKFLHAPVFMSPQMARDSIGLMLVSGAPGLFDAVRGELQKMTGEVWYVGEQGHVAASYKLFGNSMLFAITGGIADVFAMARSLDIAPADALSVFSKFHIGAVLKARGDKMARRDFSATFELAMARKDMRLMLEAADGQPLTVLPRVARRMDEAIAKGHGKDDLGAIAAEMLQ